MRSIVRQPWRVSLNRIAPTGGEGPQGSAVAAATSREAGSLHSHTAGLLEDALGPLWPRPPRNAQTLEPRRSEGRQPQEFRPDRRGRSSARALFWTDWDGRWRT